MTEEQAKEVLKALINLANKVCKQLTNVFANLTTRLRDDKESRRLFNIYLRTKSKKSRKRLLKRILRKL